MASMQGVLQKRLGINTTTMKRKLNAAWMVAVCAGLMWGCTPESIQPEPAGAASPALQGSIGDPHPALDTICQSMDTVFLMSEDGSDVINKCYGPNGQEACPNGQMHWGYMMVREGYHDGTGYLDCEITMAPGWYGDATHWKVGTANSFAFDPNGIPQVQGDWSSSVIDPLENRWVLRFPTNSLPTGSYDVVMMVRGVRLNIWGATTSGSETNLWTKNPHWGDPNHTTFSATSPLMLHFTPAHCMESASPPADTTLVGGTCQGCQSSNTVRFDMGNANCVVVSSCKDLSNVVLQDCNGVNYKFDGLGGKTGTFCHPSGLPVTKAWVKSGCYQSGDGPGYGRRYTNPLPACN